MDGILLVSKKTYSLFQDKPIVEWIEKTYAIDKISMPNDFERRLIDAELAGKAIEREFSELWLDWCDNDEILSFVNQHMLTKNEGLTDVIWYSNSLHLAFVILCHSFEKINNQHMLNVLEKDKIKKMFA